MGGFCGILLNRLITAGSGGTAPLNTTGIMQNSSYKIYIASIKLQTEVLTGTQLLRGAHFIRLILATDGLSVVKNLSLRRP